MKIRSKHITIVIFLISMLFGCVNVDEVMKSWLNHNANDLIARWGPPNQTFSDGNSGQVFVYTQQRQWVTPGTSTTTTSGYANTTGGVYGNMFNANTYGNATSTTTYTPAHVQGYEASRTFWINSYGNIYRYAWRGY